MHRARLRTVASAAGGIVLLGGVLAAPASAGAPASKAPKAEPPAPYTVIASGLNNPRHLSLTPGGTLYVAESGTGGDGPCITSSEGGQVCYGPTGSITSLTRSHSKWQQARVVTGLPSLAGAGGGGAIGPSGVVVSGRAYVASIGLGAPPAALGRGQATQSATSSDPATLPKGFATLIDGQLPSQHGHIKTHRSWRVLANLAQHEADTNPIDDPDSNPASVTRSGGSYVVADAGANAVLKVDRHGHVRTIAAFPDTMVQAPGAPAGTLMPMQFVPTAIVPAKHHAYYVSQLTGYPFPEGGASIWKVTPGHAQTVYASGLTNVTDIALAPDGSLYAVEISTAGLASGGAPIGALVRIPAGGGAAQTVVGGLFAPYGVALHGHNAYVTIGGILPGGGQVIEVPLH